MSNDDTAMSEPDLNIARRGLMLVLSSPSGAGKTTLSRRLLASDPGLTISVSVTTRLPRPGEIEGQDYVFLSDEAFDELRDRNGLLEWAEVFGNRYGTPRQPVEDALAAGHDVLFDIDWQGTQQLREGMPDDLVGIFILPPSAGELHNRLRRRAEDGSLEIAERLSNAREEIRHWVEYDHILINRDFEATLAALRAILTSERTRQDRQAAALSAFADDLIVDLEDQIAAATADS